jgi:hypothetical protein
MGLNTESASSLLGPEWATDLQNAVIDDSNRLAARKGWTDQTTTPNTDAFVSGFEYQKHAGTAEIIMATDNATIVRSTDEGVSFAAVTGTAVFTSGQWKWLNYVDGVIGLQDGKAPITYTGTTFSHIADVNVPTGGAGTAFAGRLWIVDTDGHTVKWSALLDETDWTSADSGSIDFQNVWKGTDTVQAIDSHNGALVVFGKKNIIIITDGQGSTLGIDPTQAYIADIISGVGCIAQESVQHVDGDLWFLSDSGLMSLGRLIQERSNPMDNLSKNVQSALIADVNHASFDLADLRSVYSPKDRFYLLSLPRVSGTTEVGTTWTFDTRGRLQDNSARCLGNWTGLIPTVLFRRADNDVFAANRLNEGELFKYEGQDDDNAPYTFLYRSGWTDLGAPGALKILKRIGGVFFADTTTAVGFKWAWNFETDFNTRTKTFTGAASSANWDEALWDVALWGQGSSALKEGTVIPSGTGKYIKWGIDVSIDGQEFSVQQLELFAKIGRLS